MSHRCLNVSWGALTYFQFFFQITNRNSSRCCLYKMVHIQIFSTDSGQMGAPGLRYQSQIHLANCECMPAAAWPNARWQTLHNILTTAYENRKMESRAPRNSVACSSSANRRLSSHVWDGRRKHSSLNAAMATTFVLLRLNSLCAALPRRERKRLRCHSGGTGSTGPRCWLSHCWMFSVTHAATHS